jgi:hypothetical protein
VGSSTAAAAAASYARAAASAVSKEPRYWLRPPRWHWTCHLRVWAFHDTPVWFGRSID